MGQENQSELALNEMKGILLGEPKLKKGISMVPFFILVPSSGGLEARIPPAKWGEKQHRRCCAENRKGRFCTIDHFP